MVPGSSGCAKGLHRHGNAVRHAHPVLGAHLPPFPPRSSLINSDRFPNKKRSARLTVLNELLRLFLRLSASQGKILSVAPESRHSGPKASVTVSGLRNEHRSARTTLWCGGALRGAEKAPASWQLCSSPAPTRHPGPFWTRWT